MDADRARIAELAESARRLPAAERRAFLDGFRLDTATRRAVENALSVDPTHVWNPGGDEVRLDTAPKGPRPDVSLPAAEGAAPARPADAARAMDPMLGKTFGGVEIQRIVGSGGMGRVYVGIDVASGNRVALKVLLRTQHDEARLLPTRTEALESMRRRRRRERGHRRDAEERHEHALSQRVLGPVEE